MDKEQLQEQLDEINYTTDALTHTIQYLEGCLVEILKQKEEINHQINIINNKRTKVGFTLGNKDEKKSNGK